MAEEINVEIVEDAINVEMTCPSTPEAILGAPSAENDFIAADASLEWTIKTLAETQAILDLIKHSLAVTENDFLVASGVGVFIKKSLAETKNILGLGNGFESVVSTGVASVELDAVDTKDWKFTSVDGDLEVGITNFSNSDAGMIELIIDAVGGHTVTLSATFNKCLGGTIDNTANVDNFISWRSDGTNIIYVIDQVE